MGRVDDLSWDPDEIPTKPVCTECKGEGLQPTESGTGYKVGPCKWCQGTGHRPISVQVPKQ